MVAEIVSADGQVVGELFAERRRVVPYDRIPRHVVQAFLAAEDKNFFEHHGVDWLGTLRAGVNTYVRKKKVQGGSTITQQTAKALLVSSEGFAEGTRKNLRRKAREAILASRLERAFGKQELLWLYLNGVYLGHHSYGVESAAENYFRKSVDELTLAEAALLAGLPQAPSRYSPVTHPEEARSGAATCSGACGRTGPSPRRSAGAPTTPRSRCTPSTTRSARSRPSTPRRCAAGWWSATGTSGSSARGCGSSRHGPRQAARRAAGHAATGSSTSTGARGSGGRWGTSRGPSGRPCAGASPRPGRPGRSARATSRWASSRR